jgi:predicted metal-dependent peptidase
LSAVLSQADPIELGPDLRFLTRELDKTKSGVFLGKNAAFLGSLMSSLNFQWDSSLPTAATDGVGLWWNPDFFLKLKPEVRKTVLMHELWHPGFLHFVRMGDRDPKLWNIACDHKINLGLKAEGYSFEGIEWACMDPKYVGWVEEDIYDDLVKENPPPPPNYRSDMKAPSKEDMARAVNNVVRAVHQTRLNGGGAGSIPGDVEVILKKFLAPVVPWEQLLHQFMRDLIEENYSWQRPNRRFPGMYLPSRHMDEGKLSHLMYYEDASGSISDKDNIRFNSEIKYVKETYNPHQLTLVQFDTRITQEVTYEENDPFEEIKIIGRGGTCLKCVREHIIQHRPTAAIIFSDLECDPMEPLPFDIPLIWVCIRNRGKTVPHGKLVHIR